MDASKLIAELIGDMGSVVEAYKTAVKNCCAAFAELLFLCKNESEVDGDDILYQQGYCDTLLHVKNGLRTQLHLQGGYDFDKPFHFSCCRLENAELKGSSFEHAFDSAAGWIRGMNHNLDKGEYEGENTTLYELGVYLLNLEHVFDL